LRQAGFTNINLDFIFGVPGQSPESWRATLAETIHLGPEHIATYCLTYEEDTEFLRRLQSKEWSVDLNQDAEFYEISMVTLGDAGYEQYEISNFSKSGRECSHNLAYWEGADYLGLGPSAFSTLGEQRHQNVPDTASYITAINQGTQAANFTETVSPKTRRAERLAFGLRTNRGISIDDLDPWQEQIDDLHGEQYFERIGDRLRLTQKGKMVADSIAEFFL
jgi:oxygen-independent coproporphyrinogen III oxidase